MAFNARREVALRKYKRTGQIGQHALSKDRLGQGLLAFIPFLIALVFIVGGIYLIATGCAGLGLVSIGVGAIIGGFGGTLEAGYGALVAGGTAGFVLIVVGVAVRTWVTGC